MPDADTIRIHGLREADLADAPPLDEVLDGLLEALTGRALVAHVAAVERGFLDAALSERGLELRNPIVDTAALDRELRRLAREPPSEHEPIALSDLARGLGLPVHRPHHADGDALTTAQAFIALATHLEAVRAPDLGDPRASLRHEAAAALTRPPARPIRPRPRARLADPYKIPAHRRVCGNRA